MFAQHEWRVINMIADGKSVKEIVDAIHVTRNTVMQYSNLMRKKMGNSPIRGEFVLACERLSGCLRS